MLFLKKISIVKEGIYINAISWFDNKGILTLMLLVANLANTK